MKSKLNFTLIIVFFGLLIAFNEPFVSIAEGTLAYIPALVYYLLAISTVSIFILYYLSTRLGKNK